MSKLSKEEVLKLARLARLTLSDDEVVKFQEELGSIFDYFDLLDKADITGLEPTSQVTGLVNVFRADEVKEQAAKPQDLLNLLPDREEDYIRVKRMI